MAAADTTEQTPWARRSRRLWRLVGSVLLAGLFVGILLSQLELADLTSLLRSVSGLWVLGAVGAYMAMAIARGVRFWLMTKRSTSIVRLSAIAGAQALLLSILPMRTGEVSFVGLLGRERGVGVSWASKILVAVRLLDLAAVSIIFIIAASISSDVPVAARAVIPLATLGLAAPVGLLAWPAQVAGVVRRPVMWVVGNPLLGRLPGISKLSGFLDRTMSVSDPRWFRRMLPGLLALSVAVWGASTLLAYACLRALAVPVGGLEAAFLTSILVLSSVLPIHGIGGYGPQNAIGAGLLMSLGIARHVAIPAHLAWHTLQLAIAAVVGAVGWLITTATEPRGSGEVVPATGADGREE